MALPPPWRSAIDGWQRVGGQGIVFAVQRPGDEAVFALKRLSNPARRERFENEIEAMRALAQDDPPIVPPVIESGSDSRGRPYFVMPFYPDGSLEEAVRVGGYRSDHIVGLDMLLSTADALSRAHARGWAHRDLKPPNILIDGRRPLLGDFGLALLADDAASRLTDVDEAVGSRLYIAPENESGLNPSGDQRPADFYAFAKIAWAVLAGRQPPARERQTEPDLRLAALLVDRNLEGVDLLLEAMLRTDPDARLADWAVVTAELRAARALIAAPAPSGHERAIDAVAVALQEAARFSRGATVSRGRREREASERRQRQLAVPIESMARGFHEAAARYPEITEAGAGEIVLEATGGGMGIRDLIRFGLLPDPPVAGAEGITGAGSGLGAADNSSAGQATIRPREGADLPTAYIAGYVYTENDNTWLLRVVFLGTYGTSRPQPPYIAPTTLVARFSELRGPFPVGLGQVASEAYDLGARTAAAGIDLFIEYVRQSSQGRDLLADSTWSMETSDSA